MRCCKKGKEIVKYEDEHCSYHDGYYRINRVFPDASQRALRTLKTEGKPIVKCPPGRSRPGDVCTNEKWASEYQKLIWVLEVIRDYLNEQGYPFSLADVEMALFMMGK